MELKFSKYHGTGNDFLLVRRVDIGDADPAELARGLCARTTGVGADGLILVAENPLEMIIYNSDGSLAPMCGNGIRCFAAFCADEGIGRADIYPVKTGAGELAVAVLEREPFFCEIDMGKPDFSPIAAGVAADGPDFLRKTVGMPDGRGILASSLLMGTYHTVVWLNENAENGAPALTDEEGLEAFGKELHELPIFPKKTNVNMAVVTGRDEITLRTYERGAGMTSACGTGACATAVIARLEGKVSGDRIRVRVAGGELEIRFDGAGNVFMSGPAVRIAKGVCYRYR
jgi:diaminopimelate epimerase